MASNSKNTENFWAVKTIRQQESKIEDIITEEQKLEILAEIETVWFDETLHDRFHVNKIVSNIFSGYLQKALNPFSLTIYLVENSRDFKFFKTTTLSFFLLKELDKWLHSAQNKDTIDREKLLSEDLRCQVYHVTTGRNWTYFDLAVKVFHLKHDGNEYFLPFIRYNLKHQKYKEAAIAITKLGLQDYFELDEVLTPLLLQDKVNMLENFIIGKPKLQKEVVQMLDKLCDRDNRIEDFINKSGVEVVKRGNLNRKTLSKLAVRLMKLYDIPAVMCPNITNARGFGALKYLLYKRYIEMSMGSGSWEEMIHTTVGNSQYLKEQLVEQLLYYNELHEAVKWANNFDLPESSIPQPVLEARIHFEQQKMDDVDLTVTGVENWDNEALTDKDMSVYYYQLTLHLENITMVDNKQLLSVCSERLSIPNTVIGIDSEWKPSMGTDTSGISIIQLAVKDHIFLFDVLTLTKILQKEDISNFMKLVFCNPNTVKLGYGFDADLHMLIKSFPFLKDVLVGMCRFVDLATLSKRVLDRGLVMLNESELIDENGGEENFETGADPVVRTAFTKSEEKGLSELVRQCLGKPLCKNEQMSNWEKRPLREKQIVYASLDAFVLLEIYDYLKDYCIENKIQVELETPLKLNLSKKSKQEKKKARAAGSTSSEKKNAKTEKERSMFVPNPRSRADNFMSPSQLRVICDTMLQGAGRYLRSCGVDVKMLENHENHDKAIEIGLKEGRLILSSGNPFQKIQSYVGKGSCYNVKSYGAKEQATEVLQHFNVKVTPQDIFSRCQVCNGDKYAKMPSSDMISISIQRDLLDDLDGNCASESQFDNCLTSKFYEEYGINYNTLTFVNSNVTIKIELIPKPMLSKVDWFFVCIKCGKVFWEGSHFSQVCDQFSHILSFDDQHSDSNIYHKDQKS